jgi:hypothetical protein
MPLIDFLKMDYDKLQQYLYEQWDEDIDTKTSATGMRLLKVLSSVGFMNVVYLKKSFQNAIFSDATDRNIVVKKARSEKGYKTLPVVSSYVAINITLLATKTNTVIIPKWTKLSTQTLTTNYTFYTIEDTTIPAGELSTTVLAVEGSRIQLTFMAQGINYESFEIKRSDITLREMEVYVNGTQWEKVDDILDASSVDYKWTYEPGDEGKISVMFGNGTYGRKLSLNDVVDVWCLVSAGTAGNIKSNTITKVDSVIYDSTFTLITDIVCNNPNKPYGGADMEDIATIIPNSYNAYKSNWGLVTLDHYTEALVALTGIDRAFCVDINTSLDVPFRQVWAYIVDSGGNDVADPYLSETLNYVDVHKVVGTEFYVKPILYVNYEVSINIWLHTGYNSTQVVSDVTDLINTTYSKPGMEISANVMIAKIGADLNAMDAIANYDIVSPASDVVMPDTYHGYLANAVTVTVTMMGYL